VRLNEGTAVALRLVSVGNAVAFLRLNVGTAVVFCCLIVGLIVTVGATVAFCRVGRHVGAVEFCRGGLTANEGSGVGAGVGEFVKFALVAKVGAKLEGTKVGFGSKVGSGEGTGTGCGEGGKEGFGGAEGSLVGLLDVG